jgi:uncharacterized protein (TIGR02996 family)
MNHAAFLEAVIARPEDDAPRLAYADWLEENDGPARAEFIRLQCARARLPWWEPRARLLEARAGKLLAARGEEWAAPVRGLVARWGFRRGFVEEVTLPAAAFAERGAEVFRLAPVLHARLTHLHSAYSSVLHAVPLEALTGLLARLRSLDVSENQLPPSALDALGGANAPLRLTALKASLPPDGALGLLTSPSLGRLESLDLNLIGADNPAWRPRQQEMPAPANLRHLRVRYLARRVGLAALLESPLPARLTFLGLGHNRLTVDDIGALATTPDLAGLEELDLAFNNLAEEGARALAGSPHLKGLVALNLSRCGLGDDGVRRLAASPLFGRLAALDLSLNHVTDAGAEALAAYRGPVRLRTLDLIYNAITPAGRDLLRERFGADVCLFDR